MTSITLVLTYACNQNCLYCYQIKKDIKMDFATAKKTIDYFSQKGNGEAVINLYGGEPLLEFELMKKIISYGLEIFKKNECRLRFSLTTNGSLFDRERLAYCAEYDVDIYLSIDGDRNTHESGRGKNSFRTVENVLALYEDFPEIPLKIQMVITPSNVCCLLQSVQYLVSIGVCDLSLNLCYDQKWNKKELETLQEQYHQAYTYLRKVRKEGSKIQFKEKRSPDPLDPLFRCDAGGNRYAITPDGFIYGCSMHIPWSKKAAKLGTAHHFSDLCLGHVNDLSKNKISERSAELSMDKRLFGQYFFRTSTTKCRECDFITKCDLCPAYAMIFNEDQYLVPDWICELKRVECRIQ